MQDIQGLHSFVILGHNGTFYIPFIPLSFRPFLLPILNPTLALPRLRGGKILDFSSFSCILLYHFFSIAISITPITYTFHN